MSRAWRSLVVRAVLFVLPLAAIVALACWALVRVGELACVDIPGVLHAQRAERDPERAVLYGPAYSDCTAYLKRLGVEAVRPDVLVLGTSRSVEVRAEFFRGSFYNAGGLVARTAELSALLSRLPRTRQPRVVFIVLDQFLLNAATDAAASLEFRPFDERLDHCESRRDFVEEAWPRVYRDAAARKLPWSLFVRPAYPSGLGIRGRLYGGGYRRDGSYRIGEDGASPFDEVRGRMAHGNRRYEHGDDVSPEMVAALRRFLDDASARGIFVAAMLPPYAPTIYDEMNEQAHWRYVQHVYATVRPDFDRHGFVLADYSDARALGLRDGDFYDGFHGSEHVIATLLLRMARENPRMEEIVATDRIEQLLAARPDAWQVVPGL